MKPVFVVRAAIALATAVLLPAVVVIAQDTSKPVPKNSVRVSVPGCSKDYIFTAIARREDQPGSTEVAPGMHLRMNGKKALMKEIKAHEGSVIVITGLMRLGQPRPEGVSIGGGIRIAPGPAPNGGLGVSAAPSQNFIDVEGWRPGTGECPGR